MLKTAEVLSQLSKGKNNEDIIRTAASICARYSDARMLPYVEVKVFYGHEISLLKVVPANDDIVGQFRVEKPQIKPYCVIA